MDASNSMDSAEASARRRQTGCVDAPRCPYGLPVGRATAPPGAWPPADRAPEGAGEMGLIGEADVDRDLRERRVALQHELLGLGDPRLQQPLVRREPGRDLE